MIEPNRLTVPGETAARDRVEVLFARIDELGPAVRYLPVPRLDLAEREVLLADLQRLADQRGRGRLLDEARTRVRDGLLVVAGTRLQPGWIGQPMATSGTTEDQVARLLAIEDAVSVAVMADVIDPEPAAALASPGYRMLGLPLPTIEADSGGESELTTGDPAGAWPGDDRRVGSDDGEPDSHSALAAGGEDALTADEDQAAADAEAEALEAQAALRQRRAVLFVAVIAIGVAIGIASNLGWGGLLLFTLCGFVVAWIFA